MSSAIGIKALEVELPLERVPVAELDEVRELEGDGRELFSLLRLESVAVDRRSDSVDLAVRASRKAFESAGIEAAECDVILYLQGRDPRYMMSSEAMRLQDALGAEKAFCFTVADLGCAGISGALLLARDLLAADPSRQNILIAGGSKPFGPRRYREAVTALGDGGIGLIVGRGGRHRILDVSVRTEGRFWDLYRVDFRDVPSERYREACSDTQQKFQLALTSFQVFEEMNERILRENDLDAVDGFIMQNLSMAAFEYWERAFKIRFLESCRENCRSFGHLGSIDIMLNFKRSVEKGEIREGDVVLVMNNSPAACWSTMLVKV